MRTALTLTTIALLGAGQGMIVPPTIDQGVVIYTPATTMPPTVYCPPQLTCSIGLDAGEQIHDVLCPGATKRIGATGWTIDLGDGARPYLYVTPTFASPPTDLIITTNHRRITVLLYASVDAKARQHLAYEITGHQPQAATPAPALPSPSPTPLQIDHAFSIEGVAPFRPTLVERRGDMTFITLPDGRYAKPGVVVVSAREGKGEPITMPCGWSYQAADNSLAVQGVFDELELYVGDGPQQQRVYIKRTAP